MAKKATSKTGGRAKAGAKGAAKSKAVTDRRSSGRDRRVSDSAGDAFIKLLQSPLVAELVAVAATAALASLAEEGFGNRGTSGGKRAGRAVKHAGKAAANAIGRRLSTEIDEIKKAAKAKKA
jgi:hypothetical protein